MKKVHTFSLKRTFASVAALSMFFGVFMSLFTVFAATHKAAAQAPNPNATFTWVNAGTITMNGKTYFTDDLTLNAYGTPVYKATNSTPCTYNGTTVDGDYMTIDTTNSAPDQNGGTVQTGIVPESATLYTVDLSIIDAAKKPTCKQVAIKVHGTSVQNSKVLFYRSGDTVTSYNNGVSFTKTATVNADGSTGLEVFTQSDQLSEPCPDVLVHGTNGSGDYKNDWFIIPMTPKDQSDASGGISEKYERLGFPNANANCRVNYLKLQQLKLGTVSGPANNGQFNVYAVTGFTLMFYDDAFRIDGGVGTLAANGPPAGTTPPGGNTPNGPSYKSACDQSFGLIGFVSLKWFICPVIDIMTRTVQMLEDFLVQNLQIPMDPLASNTAYHKIWASLRTIALAIIVIVALVMVIFQAAGAEAFSAYTMRTLFARFGVALIFIVLSWSILREVVQIVNWITEGARTLIYAPFNAATQGGAGLETGSAFVLAALAGAGIIALGPWGLLSFVLTGILSIGLTLLVLVLVHALIYTLIMFSPVAIALSILPGTRKGYEIPKNAFISACAGLAAVAFAMPALDVMAESTYNLKTGTTSAIVYQILALLIKFMRVFIVLFIFSRIGGAIGTITGMVNDRGRGAFDRLKNFRGNTMKNRAAKASQGELYSNKYALGRAFNKTTRAGTAFAKADSKKALFTKTGRASALAEHDQINAARYGKTEKAQAAMHNDPLLQAQTYRSAQEARQNMARDWGMSQDDAEKAIKGAEVNGGFSFVRQQNAARQLARTGTGYKNLDQLHNTVNRVAGGNDDMVQSLLGGINSETKGAGRFDLATGHGHQIKINEARRALNTTDVSRVGQAERSDDSAALKHYRQMVSQGYVEAVKGTNATDMLRSKPQAMDNTMPAVTQAIYAARDTMNDPHAGYDADGNSLQQKAAEEYGRLNTVVETYKRSTAYAAPAAVQKFEESGYRPTANERRDTRQQTQQSEQAAYTVRNPTTGATSTVMNTPESDTSGNVLFDRNGQPIYANRGYDPDIARGVKEQAAPVYDPNDPRMQN